MKNIKSIPFLFLFALIFLGTGYKKDNHCPSCKLEPEGGPCRAVISKYYFDKEDGKCKEFTWGGCYGVVPFDTLEECEECDCND